MSRPEEPPIDDACEDALSLEALRAENRELREALTSLRAAKSESERRMQRIMDLIPVPIYAKDMTGHFTFANQKVADLHRMKREELIGKTLFDILPADIAEAIHQNDLDIIATAKTVEFEERAPQPDGMRHYLSIKFPMFDDSGVLVGVGGTSTDITERIRAEESLRISQQRLLLHREQSPVGVIEWNTDFEFLDWNPAAERIFGYTKEEVQGQHITKSILPESARPAVDQIWRDLMANTGGTYSLNENTTKDGRTILCEWHNTPLVDHEGCVIGVTSLVDDVTGRQHEEQRLRHSQKMDAIGKLTGGIAHDFNNSLTVILGYADLLSESRGLDDMALESVDQILIAAQRSKQLTSKLLAFSREQPDASAETDINQRLQGQRAMLEKALTPRIRLNLELSSALWPVWLDPSRFEDAVLNMGINSMYAMPGGGALTLATKNIVLSPAHVESLDLDPGEYVVLSVRDTGCGMDAETQQKLFDPFFTTKGSEGTGLGMSQVYGFVQQSRGAITVQSAEGQGTRLTLYFPRFISEDIAPSPPAPETASLDGTEAILVVDDEPAVARLATLILSRRGYRVHTATSAAQALEILEKESIALVLSDVIMPEVDGHELAQRVIERYPDVRVQLMSGYNDERHAHLVGDSINEELLAKPFSAAGLLDQIRKVLDAPS